MDAYEKQLKQFARTHDLKLESKYNKAYRGPSAKKYFMIQHTEAGKIIYVFSDPGFSHIYSGVVMPVVNKYDFKLKVRPKSPFKGINVFRKRSGQENVKTGNTRFDKRYEIKTSDNLIALNVLKDKLIQQFFEQKEFYQLFLADDFAFFEQTPESGKSALCLLSINDWIIDEETVSVMKTTLLQAAAILVQKRMIKATS